MVRYRKMYPMKKSIETFIILIIFTFVLPLFASRPYQPKMADPILEPWRWRSYPELDGKGVLNMTEAVDGSIWFGLQRGAMHYDGLNWTLYDDQNSLLDSQVDVIAQAKDGSIYFGTSGSGLIRFSDGEWESIPVPYFNENNQSVNCIIQASDQSIWVCIRSTGMLAIQNGQKTLYTTHQIGATLRNQYPEVTFVVIPEEIITSVMNGSDAFNPYWIHEIDSMDFLFAINNGIIRCCLGTAPDDEDLWIDVTPETYTHTVNDDFDNVYIFGSSDGLIWVYDWSEAGELFQYDSDRDEWSVIDLIPYGGTNRTFSIQETADGTLWVGDFGQFFIYKDQQWRSYQSAGLELPQIDMLFLASSDGNLWIAGQQNKVYRIDYTREFWMTYQGLNYQCESNGLEWFISVDGAVISHEKETDKWTSYDTRDGLIDEPVVLLCTRDGTVWAAGSHQKTAATAFFHDGRWIKKIHFGLGYSIDYRSACELLDGTLMFGVKDIDTDRNQNGGIARYDRFNNAWDYIQPPIINFTICGFGQTPDGSLWYGGMGLNKLDEDTSFIAEGHNDFQLPWFDYLDVAPDGILWTIKGGIGVYRYDPVGQVVTKYTVENGLAGLTGSSILCLNDTSVLVATDKGISRFDGYTWKQYGLPEVLRISRESGDMRQSEDGSIWLNMASRFWYQRAMSSQRFTEDMLPEFKTIRFKPDRLPPDTQVNVANDRVPSHGNVYGEWSGSDVWNQSLPNYLEYSYRLNEGEWSDFSDEINHLFISMKSGDYNLEVRARDGGFNIDPTPAAIRFTVMPPVWRQAWFIGMVVLFVGAIGFFEWRVIQRERRLHVSNISLKERTEELHASNNQLEMANKKIIKTSKALRHSNKALEQSKKILEYANKEALDREQYLMYALMNNVTDKIYFKDREGRFIRVNKATSMAHGIMNPQEMVGASDFDFFDKDYAQEAVEYEQEVMRTGQPIEKEEKEKWSDGHEMWVSTMKQPLKDLKGNIVGTFGITRDITERKLAEIAIQKANEAVHQKAEALERSNQELQQFAYVAYHDLQEPLRMVASYVQLLADRYKEKLDGEANEFIDYAVDGTKRIKQLIKDLLIYSGITTNSKPFQPVNCEAVFGRIEMNLNVMIEEFKAVVKHDRLPIVLADETQLERLFFNLIDNAMKYHGEKTPEIYISADKNGKSWLFSIRDNGIGIAPEFHEKIFGIFKRLHNMKEYSGTGMGLAVCKKIVEHHGGKIWVESDVGKGAAFYFTLPMMEDINHE